MKLVKVPYCGACGGHVPMEAVGRLVTQAEIVLRCYYDGFAARLIEANPGSEVSRVA